MIMSSVAITGISVLQKKEGNAKEEIDYIFTGSLLILHVYTHQANNYASQWCNTDYKNQYINRIYI